MEKKLQDCIVFLTKAKELVSDNDPNVELSLTFLDKAEKIITEFDSLELEEKAKFKEELLQIQALTQVINVKLSKEKAKLKTKMLKGHKMANAVKGYSKGSF